MSTRFTPGIVDTHDSIDYMTRCPMFRFSDMAAVRSHATHQQRMDRALRMAADETFDCFRDTAREMGESPDVALIQHESGVFDPFDTGNCSYVKFIFIRLGQDLSAISPPEPTDDMTRRPMFRGRDFRRTKSDTQSAIFYLVLARPSPSTPASDDEPHTPRVMEPYEAAKKAVELLDGSTFLERMICVDVAHRGSACAKPESSLGDVGMVGADTKLSVFVGNLNFESREEDLRAERGPPTDAMESDNEDDDVENDEKWTKLKKLKK
ncbi:hypothetical protein BDN72DRAFT_866203 [Pluteus cervinus]|uniref:Uncharacterized protein n=1 Tax=Pluteus cervinus TaxID=181527 RepID=A0ACD2ZX78_9AGAR|nr:hypothetical protein BDN72DRAFT_866203 [Pluteus cervinus]